MKEDIDFPISDGTPLKIKEKLPIEDIKQLQSFIRSENFDNFQILIINWDLNYKSINQIKKVISKFTPSKAYMWANKLSDKDDTTSNIITGLLYIKSAIWERDVEFAKKIIVNYTKCDEWKIRAIGITLFATCIIKKFPMFKEMFNEFIKSEDSKFRRVAISAAQQVASYKGKIDFLNLEFLDLLTPYLTERDAYVNSVSNETFGSYIKNHPDIFYTWIDNKVEELKDNYGKASILYILSNVNATRHVKESCRIIDMYIKDNDIIVKRARSAALRNLAKYHSKNISSWLETRMHIPQAVDHWSELEIDGLLTGYI